MDYIKSLFNHNFLEYASYVIRDRAIPDLEDGLKPVQRRILHTMFEMDDGKFHKVANVVGQCMKYHPHGDAAIADALVVLANKGLFVDRQGNFGNIFTGDAASASRYIECRVSPLAKELMYNPEITKYVGSYDGRNREPTAFRAKLPIVLALGAEGIAVGMSTKILPHNVRELIEAEKACLQEKKFKLYPDFPTGGFVDVSGYGDGLGKVLVRAKLDLSDEKRIVVRELPFGSTTESLIASVENAAKSGKVKISEINDFTTEKVEIEIKLQRGVYAKDVVDALYAFTECEQSISCNLLVIRDNMPVLMTVTDIIKDHAKKLVRILKEELELEKASLTDRLHARTLERIFVEERIYKKIESMKTAEGVVSAVLKGFEPFAAELIREVTEEDVDRLLKIPIRRISLYDINKNRAEVAEINARIKEVNKLLRNLVGYAITVLDGILAKLPPEVTARKTELTHFTLVDVKEAVNRDTPLRYDAEAGYLGLNVSGGTEILRVTPYDRILVMRKSGVYTVMDVPDKLFVDKGMWYCGFSEKEVLSKVLFTVVYKDAKTGYPCIKRCRIEGYILNRDYLIVPDGAVVLYVGTAPSFTFTVHYEPKARLKTREETFRAQDFAEKGLKTLGVRLSPRVAVSVTSDAKPALVSGRASADDADGDKGAETTVDASAPTPAASGAQSKRASGGGLRKAAELALEFGDTDDEKPSRAAPSSGKGSTAAGKRETGTAAGKTPKAAAGTTARAKPESAGRTKKSAMGDTSTSTGKSSASKGRNSAETEKKAGKTPSGSATRGRKK